jgi:hypothetical protein
VRVRLCHPLVLPSTANRATYYGHAAMVSSRSAPAPVPNCSGTLRKQEWLCGTGRRAAGNLPAAAAWRFPQPGSRNMLPRMPPRPLRKFRSGSLVTPFLGYCRRRIPVPRRRTRSVAGTPRFRFAVTAPYFSISLSFAISAACVSGLPNLSSFVINTSKIAAISSASIFRIASLKKGRSEVPATTSFASAIFHSRSLNTASERSS